MNLTPIAPSTPAAGIVFGGLASTVIRRWKDSLDERLQRRKYYKRLMAAAASYDQWKEIAESLYKMEETDLPATEASIKKEAQLYDRKLLQNKTSHMKRIGQLANAQEIMFAMRIDLTRNIANIAKRFVHINILSINVALSGFYHTNFQQNSKYLFNLWFSFAICVSCMIAWLNKSILSNHNQNSSIVSAL